MEDMSDAMEAQAPGMRARIIEHYLGILRGPGVESGNRLEVMLALLKFQPSAVFWPVFHRAWPRCHATWEAHEWLETTLLRHNARRTGTNFLADNNKAWFDTLPETIEVFRGCSRQRVRGVSWTTDPTVAEGFAKDQGIEVLTPVVVAARIPKSAVMGAYTVREEDELLVDPSALTLLHGTQQGTGLTSVEAVGAPPRN